MERSNIYIYYDAYRQHKWWTVNHTSTLKQKKKYNIIAATNIDDDYEFVLDLLKQQP